MKCRYYDDSIRIYFNLIKISLECSKNVVNYYVILISFYVEW